MTSYVVATDRKGWGRAGDGEQQVQLKSAARFAGIILHYTEFLAIQMRQVY